MFKVGDAVVHPARGAGVVAGFERLQRDGSTRRYYNIELLGDSSSNLMVPVESAESIGLRPAVSRSRLKEVWGVLHAKPDALPSDHKARYSLVEAKLQAGDILRIAEAVRDMAWRKKQRGNLTGHGKRIYQRGMMLLTAEIAAAQGVALTDAEAQVRARLQETPCDRR
jgi:CarD family transcriptional regulator